MRCYGQRTFLLALKTWWVFIFGSPVQALSEHRSLASSSPSQEKHDQRQNGSDGLSQHSRLLALLAATTKESLNPNAITKQCAWRDKADRTTRLKAQTEAWPSSPIATPRRAIRNPEKTTRRQQNPSTEGWALPLQNLTRTPESPENFPAHFRRSRHVFCVYGVKPFSGFIC